MTAEEIVRELAFLEPLVRTTDDLYGESQVCGLCDDESHSANQGPAHRPNCLWLKARAWEEANPDEGGSVSDTTLWYCVLVSRAVAVDEWVDYGDHEPCEPGVPCCDGCRWVLLTPGTDPREGAA